MQFGGCLNFIATLIVLAASLLLVANVETSTMSAPIVVESIDTAEVYASVPTSRGERDGSFILGADPAPITIVVFTDFFCPACQNFKTTTLDTLVTNDVATVQAALEIRLLPTAASPYSEFAAHMAECAADSTGQFGLVFDTLFDIATDQSIPDAEIGRELSDRLNLNYPALLECAGSLNLPQAQIDSDLASLIGVTGAPAVRIRYPGEGIDMIPGASQSGAVPYEVLVALIEAANDF